MHNIDVYMALLIEELQVLWKGVVTYDVLKVETQRCAFWACLARWSYYMSPTYHKSTTLAKDQWYGDVGEGSHLWPQSCYGGTYWWKSCWNLLILPSFTTLTYRKMKAYGYHFCVDDESNSTLVTYDFNVASIFQQSQGNEAEVLGVIQYVGTLK